MATREARRIAGLLTPSATDYPTRRSGLANPERDHQRLRCREPRYSSWNSCPAIPTAIKTARSPLRWVPTGTSAAGRRAPVRSTPVSHLHQAAVRWTRHSLSCIRSRQSRMRRNWYYQGQRPDQGQSEDAQFSLLPQSGFRHPAHNGSAATFCPAGRDYRCEIGKDGMAVEHVGDV